MNKPVLARLALIPALLSSLPVGAQIVADPSAPAGQRPTVLNAANGVPQVNIQTPSAAGVSRNTYSQFDVQSQGAILNNARNNAQTQLGGWVQGNPWLAAGTAKVILNEVNSSNPSLLKGYIEVAGDRAQVVIANPSGISCDGCGFINSNRATLTTGSPIMNGGSLDGYRVQGGTITVTGAGMDASRTDYTDIIARAVQVNAGIWANTLSITTGANQVDAANTQATPVAGAGAAPSFALDVSALGGMYAGKIMLIGTEAGVGVRNAGQIGASAGDVVVTVDGRLLNGGSITSSGNTQITASGGAANSGTIYAQGDLTLQAAADITNSGTLAAQGNTTLTASGANGGINSSGTGILAAGVLADGTVAGAGQISVSASQSVSIQGQTLSGGDQAIRGSVLDLSGSRMSAANLTLAATAGNVDASNAIVAAAGTLGITAQTNAGQWLINDNGTLSANQLDLSVANLSNRQGKLQQFGTGNTNLTLVSGSTRGVLDNTLGLIATNGGNLSLSASQIVNTQGDIQHNGSGLLAINAGTFSGNRGSLFSNGVLNLSVTGAAVLDGATTQAAQISLAADSVSHLGGQMIQTGSGLMQLAATHAFDNTGGIIAANGSIVLTADSLTNQGGTIQAAGSGNLSITTAALLDNSAAGLLAANGAMALTAGQLDNRSGQIASGQSLTALIAGAVRNAGGAVVGNGNVALNAATLDNTAGMVASAAGTLSVTTTGATDNTTGKLEASGDIALVNTGLTNDAGTVAGKNVTIATGPQALSNRGGAVAAAGSLAIDSGALNNDTGLIQSGGAMTIDTHGQTLTNTNAGSLGGILSQASLTLTTAALNNTAGFIGAQGPLSIAGTTLTNTGQIASASNVGIDVATFNNAGGQTVAGGNLSIDTGGGAVDNTGGLLRANSARSVTAASVVNRQTSGANQGIEGQTIDIAAQIDNTQGAMRASQSLTLTGGGSINNTGGLLSSALDLTLRDPLAVAGQNAAGKTLSVTNTGGTMIAGRTLAIDSAYLSGDGTILSLGDIGIKVLRDYLHTGQTQANGAVSLETAGILTNQSTFQAGTMLTLKAATLDNQAGGQFQAPSLHLQATDTHTFTNRGLINGSDTFIDAITLNNLGTGRIYGDHVALSATTLNNAPENGVAPVIAARNRLDIGATNVYNLDGALIYSGGDMAFGGRLDANHFATGQGGTLTNSSATIAADGNLSLAFNQVTNQRTSFSVSQQTDGGQAQYVLLVFTPPGPWGLFLAQWITQTNTIVNADSGAAKISSGGSMWINGAVTNDKSSIMAGGSIALDGARYTGIGQQGQTISNAVGVTYYCVGCAQGGYGDFRGYLVLDGPTVLPGDATYQQHILNTLNIVKSVATPSALQQWSITGVPSDVGYTYVQTGTDDFGNPIYVYMSPLGGTYSPYSSSNTLTATYNLAPAVLSANQSITGTATTIANLNLVGTGRTASSPTVASPNLIAPVAASNVRQVSSVAAATGAAGTVIRSVAPNTRIPNNALYKVNASPSSHYLIETDPAFASYQTWLSSDYLLAAMGVDPATTQKRLGDGFYEQQLVRDQVAQLTGSRYLAGYSSDQAEYQALMNAGVTFAKAQGLVPGVALTPAQVAQLTSDIVWLVEQTVTLPDGSTTKVLLPQVYVRVQPGDVDSNGSLIAANNIDLQVSGDLTNNGTIAGRQVLSLSADNVNNLGGRLAGNAVSLQAVNDLNNIAGEIRGGDSLAIQAGRDINVTSTTADFHEESGTIYHRDVTSLNRIAGLYVTNAGGMLTASAGRDLNLTAAVVDSAGSAGLGAGHDLKLTTLQTSDATRIDRDADNYTHAKQTAEAGSVVHTAGDLTLSAGTDLAARAANITSDSGAVTLAAGRDVSLVAGQATSEFESASKDESSGFFSSKTTIDRNYTYDTAAQGTTVSGDRVTVVSGRDTTVKGSDVVATHDVTIAAQRTLSIEAAEETSKRDSFHSETESGLFSNGGLSITLGTRSQKATDDGSQVWHAGSTVGSVQGNVTLLAGQDYQQLGSSVLAPGGDISITAPKVEIGAVYDTAQDKQTFEAKQSGITLSVTSPIITAAQTADQMAKAATKTSDPRMQALAAASVALNVYNNAGDIQKAAQALQDGKPENAATLSLSVGSSHSQSNSQSNSRTAVGSTVAAGNDLTIQATNGDLSVIGSTLTAGRNASLAATGDVDLLAAQSTSSNQSSSSGSSFGIGISVGMQKTGFTVSASRSSGSGNGADSVWTPTTVAAGNVASVTSGNDTNIKGATVSAKQVIADVGNNLAIESLQDTSTYHSNSSSVGGSITVSPAGVPTGGSFSAGASKIDSDYASVNTQAGIQAGDGGFQVNVAGNTDLKGGVIASTQQAVDDGKNSFSTGGALTLSDIQNKADYKGSAWGVNLGAGQSLDGKLVPQGTSAGIGQDSGSASSTTQAGISGVAGNTAVRTGDTANGLQKIFDATRVQNEINAQVQITQQFGREAATAIGDYANAKMNKAADLRLQAEAIKKTDQAQADALIAQAQAIEDQWGTQGTLRLLAHAMVGGLTGGWDGAAGATAGTLAGPMIEKALADAGIDGPLAETIAGLASTAVGGILGGGVGAAAALNETVNNYLKHDQGQAYLKAKEGCKERGDCEQIDKQYRAISRANDEAAKQLIAQAKECVAKDCDLILAQLKQVENDMQNSIVVPGELSPLMLTGQVSQAKQQIELKMQKIWCADHPVSCAAIIVLPAFAPLAAIAPAAAEAALEACLLNPYSCSTIINSTLDGVLADGAVGAAGLSAGAAALKSELQAARAVEAAATRASAAGFNGTEAAIIKEAQGVLISPEFAKIQAAYLTGQPVAIEVNGRLIQYEPGLSASGMTMFGENGFLIGREAFTSTQELEQTILHELYRLRTSSSANGVSGALATQETRAAADFAAKAVKVLK